MTHKTSYKRSNVTCQQWTESQLELLKEAHKKHNNDWSSIVREFFPTRNVNQVKCKMQYLMTKQSTFVRIKEMESESGSLAKILQEFIRAREQVGDEGGEE